MSISNNNADPEQLKGVGRAYKGILMESATVPVYSNGS
jgi:hypothetical protein